jgi:hypothetical protein
MGEAKRRREAQERDCVPVPMPLPTKSSYATALYLFLHSDEAKAGLAFDDLCGRLGIDMSKGAAVASRRLDNTLAMVNEHLNTKLDIEALRAAGIEVPLRYEIKTTQDGFVRFRGLSRFFDEEQPYENNHPKILVLFAGDRPFVADSGEYIAHWHYDQEGKPDRDTALARAVKRATALQPGYRWWRIHQGVDCVDFHLPPGAFKSWGEIDNQCHRSPRNFDACGPGCRHIYFR